MSKSNSSSSGIGVTGLLGVAFVVLKLTNTIDWSWWWVLCPFWAMFPVFIIVAMIWATVQFTRQKKETQYFKERAKPRSKFAERLEEAKRIQESKNN